MASIVILGAGLGGMSAAYEFREALGETHPVTVIGDGERFAFTPSNPWIAAGWRKPAQWLVVIGMNSIAAYMIAHLFEDFIVSSFRTHLGQDVFAAFGTGVAPFVQGTVVLTVYWLMLWWMYRRKLFLRV